MRCLEMLDRLSEIQTNDMPMIVYSTGDELFRSL